MTVAGLESDAHGSGADTFARLTGRGLNQIWDLSNGRSICCGVGGPGANFLVQWAGPHDIDDPIIEVVMIGHSGNAGFSFISQGRALKDSDVQ
jgi:Protein of unknown function (DUF3124)